MSTPGHILSNEMDLFLREQPMTDAQLQVILATLSLPFNNYYATTAPGATNDSAEGYSVGSKWYNSVTKETYVCSDATEGAAVWDDATLTADELGSAAFSDATTDGVTNPTLVLQTDANGDFTAHQANLNYVQFDTTNGAIDTLGQVGWDVDAETLAVVLKNDTILQVGEETLYHVENATGSTITDGTPVMYAGTTGNAGKLQVQPWDGTSPKAFLGIATSDILDEDTGYVTHFGKARGFQTNGANYGETWVSGEIIYAVSGSNNLTNVTPTTGGYVIVAVVIAAHETNGTLFVRPTQVSTASEVGAVGIGESIYLTSGQGIYWGDVGSGAYLEASGNTLGVGNVEYFYSNTPFRAFGGVYTNTISDEDGSGQFIDVDNRTLVDGADSSSLEWGQRITRDMNGTFSLDWSNRTLADAGGFVSVDWGLRQLISPDGTVLAQWSNDNNFEANKIYGIGGSYGVDLGGVLLDFESPSLDWANRQLIGVNGDPTMRWDGTGISAVEVYGGINAMYLQGTGASDAFIWLDNGQAYVSDGSGNTSIDFNNRTLVDGADNSSLEWGQRITRDMNGTFSLDWSNRTLADTGGFGSVDWGLRQLIDPNGNVAAEWSNGSGGLFETDRIYGLGGSYYGIELASGYLADAGNVRLDWINGHAVDASNNLSIDWQGRQLVTADGATTALSWSDRQLITADGATTALSWSDDDFLSVGLPLHSNNYIKCGASALNDAPTASVAGLGAQLVITDAFLPKAGSVVAGGGSSSALVMSDGNDWIVTGGVGTELTPAEVDAQIEAAALTPAQIMSKAGEQLIASLQVTWPATAGTAHFATTRATSGTFLVRTSTGYARLINADGTLGAQAGTGVVANFITLTIPASGLHRALGVLSVANGGSVRSGDITALYLTNNQLTSFSSTGLSSLIILFLTNNQLTSFSGTGLSSLLSLSLENNQLTSFSGTGLSTLTTLYLGSNQLTSFSGTGLSSLMNLFLTNNQLTSFSGTGLSSLLSLSLENNQLTSFSGTGLSTLTTLYLGSNQLTSFSGTGLSSLTNLFLNTNQLTTFDGTGLSSLTGLYIRNNQLTSIDGGGMELSDMYYYYSGSDFRANDLSASALNAFFTTLGDAAGVLMVGGNPGSATCDPTIATDKGYTVVGV